MGNKQYTLVDVIDDAIRASQLEVHTALPAEVQSYKAEKQTVQVKIGINRVINFKDKPYPIIDDVPVCFPRSKGYGITFPLNKGDSVLLVFNERNTDRWRSTGAGQRPIDSRLFDINDAVAIPGFFPSAGVMDPPPKDGMEVRGDKLYLGDPLAAYDIVKGLSESLKALLTATYPSAMGPAGPMAPPEATTITEIQAAIEKLVP